MTVTQNTIKLLESSEHTKYSEFIDKQENSAFEHTLEWAKVMFQNFGHMPTHLIAKNEKEEICGALALFECTGFTGQKKLVASPYAIYTTILADNENIKTELTKQAINICKEQNASFLQLREHKESHIFKDLQLKKQKNVFNMSLTLNEDINITWKKLPKSSIRWGIKKAEKSNLTVGKGVAPMHLDQFYNLFLQTRKHRGVPAYPKSYFQDIINAFQHKKNSNVKIYITYHNEEPIAAIFLIYYNNEMRYFAAGATYERELLSMQPYHLIMWQAIKDATEEGIAVFNLGGATENTNDGGLLTFKKRWSNTIEEIPYYYYLHKEKELPSTEESNLIKAASKVWRHLPTPVINWISPSIIKRFI